MKKDDYQQRLLPRNLRADYRCKQMEAIEAEIRKKYKKLIRQAATLAEKQTLAVQRDAEIAEAIEPLLREQKQDKPDCI